VAPFLFFAAVIHSGGVSAEIYKWIDEHGNVHYSDKRMNDDSAPVSVNSAAPPPDTSTAEHRQRAQELLEVFEEERREKKQAARDAEAERKQRKDNCKRARDMQRHYGEIGRLYDYDESGNKRYYSDEEIDNYRGEINEQVERWCK